MFKKALSIVTSIILIGNSIIWIPYTNAVSTNGQSNPWTQEKAEQLAKKTLFAATPTNVQDLLTAGSATAAVNLLFPSVAGPDRTAFNQIMTNFSSQQDFDWDSGTWMRKYYQLKKYKDPYEAKAKLFLIFEDIFSVDRDGNISYQEIETTHDMLYSYTLGSYKEMVKRNFYNNGQPGDYSLGRYLDLFNLNKNYPNENYARELMQLFLMLEYVPTVGADTPGAERNYTEDDVASLAKMITGLTFDENTHQVSFDSNEHNTSTDIEFLTGDLKIGDSFPFYNVGSGTLDLGLLPQSINGNNGLTDNTIDYIFSKRENEIALFLADKLFRFYIHNNPTLAELQDIADVVKTNDFDIYTTVKWLLVQDIFYSDEAMNGIYYKNPVELGIGTLKLFHYKNPDVIDPLVENSSLLYNLGWKPYNPESIFGRDGWDDNSKWFTAYTENQWINLLLDLVYDEETNNYDLDELIPTRRVLETTTLSISTDATNTFTGDINLNNIQLTLSGSGSLSGDVTFATGTIIFPDFHISTLSGDITIGDGIANMGGQILNINSGHFVYSGVNYDITTGIANMDNGATLTRDINIDEMIVQLETYLYLGKNLPTTVIDDIKTYLTEDENGIAMKFLPNNNDYERKYIRSIMAMLLAQPEYTLISGYDKAENQNAGNNSAFTNTNKIVFVELFGGYDMLHGIIPKNEYSSYVTKRGGYISQGGLAEPTSNLIDLGDFYMSESLSPFKNLYDNGELTIINRIGAPSHSRGHDSARNQYTSLENLQASKETGLFGEFIKNESDASNTIVLGNIKPTILREGNYLNIGRYGANFVNRGPLNTAEKDYQITQLKATLDNRVYPDDTQSVYKNSVKISDIAQDSVDSGGPSGAGWSIENNLSFLNTIISNNVGQAYYVYGGGGFDTHNGQMRTNSDGSLYLDNLIGNIVEEVTTFFNNNKSTENLTIVMYSEFGRTIEINGSAGTDHGNGGVMFILSNNIDLKGDLPENIYGNISVEKETRNLSSIGIDYRSIYSILFENLFDIDTTNYFGGEYILANYLDETPPRPKLFRRESEHRRSGTSKTYLHFDVNDINFDITEGSNIEFKYGDDPNDLTTMSQRRINNYSLQDDGSLMFPLRTSENTEYYYNLTLRDNQYAEYNISDSFVAPEIITNSYTISHSNDTILGNLANIYVNGTINLNDPMIIADIGTGTSLNINGHDGTIMTVYSGATNVESISANTGTIEWDGTFLLPQEIDKDVFIGPEATFSGNQLTTDDISKIIKVGADKLGLSMSLNKEVKITVPGLNQNNTYAMITSIDGVNWELFNGNFETHSNNTLSFDTDHFSYFAILEADPIECDFQVNPNRITAGGTFNLEWTSSGGGSASINQGIGTVNLNDNHSILTSLTDSGNQEYILTIRNNLASKTCSDSIDILTGQIDIGTGTTVTITGSIMTGSSIGENFAELGLTGSSTAEYFDINGDIRDFLLEGIVDNSGETVINIEILSGSKMYSLLTGNKQLQKYILSGLNDIEIDENTMHFNRAFRIGIGEHIIFDNYLTIRFLGVGDITTHLGVREGDGQDWIFDELSNNECEPVFPNYCGYIDGQDLVIKTYHITDFASVTESSNNNDDNSGDSSSGGSSGSSSRGGGGGGGGGSAPKSNYNPIKDNCPNGDYSGSYHDESCGEGSEQNKPITMKELIALIKKLKYGEIYGYKILITSNKKRDKTFEALTRFIKNLQTTEAKKQILIDKLNKIIYLYYIYKIENLPTSIKEIVRNKAKEAIKAFLLAYKNR